MRTNDRAESESESGGIKVVALGESSPPAGLAPVIEARLAQRLHRKGESWFGIAEDSLYRRPVLSEFRISEVQIADPLQLREADRLNGIDEARLVWLKGALRPYNRSEAKWDRWDELKLQGMFGVRRGQTWAIEGTEGSFESHKPCADPDGWIAQPSEPAAPPPNDSGSTTGPS